MPHGHGAHSAKDCHQLKAQAKQLKTGSSDNGDSGGSQRPHIKSKSHDGDGGKPQHSEQELNAMVQAMVKKALRGAA